MVYEATLKNIKRLFDGYFSWGFLNINNISRVYIIISYTIIKITTTTDNRAKTGTFESRGHTNNLSLIDRGEDSYSSP